MPTRRLVVEVVGDASALSKTFRGASADSARLGGSLGRLSIGFGQLIKGTLIVEGLQKALEGLDEALHFGIEGFTNTTKVAAQTAAVLKSTGGAANVTAKQVHALAASLSNVSGIDDEVIQTGENALLAFTHIRDFAGKGNQIFTDASKAITDYAARTGKDLPQAAIVFGRALEDPANKLAGLSRAGIVFTKSQIAAVKAMVKTGDTLGAQRKIIADLAARYGGAAKAAGKTLPGQLNILRERFKDLAGELVGGVLPAFSGVIGALTETVVKVTEASGFRAKLNIVWTGIEGAAKGAQSAIGDAIGKVDWDKVWAGANGIAEGLQKRLQAVDWTGIGKDIGSGIATAVSVAASAVKPIAEKIQNVVGAIDFVKIGKAAGPGLAVAIVTAFTTITDPTFWIKNWELALAVGSVAFGGPLGRLGGRLAAPFARLGVRLGEDLALALSGAMGKVAGRIGDLLGGALGKAADAIEGVAPRLGRPLIRALDALSVEALKAGETVAHAALTGFLKLPGLIEQALSPITGLIARAFGRLGGLTRFTIKVLGAEAVLHTIEHVVGQIAGVFSGLAKTIGHALDGAWKELERGAIKAALAIVEPFTHIPTELVGHKFQDIKASLQTQLDGMVTSSQTAAAKMQAAFDSVKPPAALAGPATVANQVLAAVPRQVLQRPTGSSGGTLPVPPGLPPPPVIPATSRRGLTAAQRNQFFDSAISSDLTRAGLIPSIKGQIAALQNIAGLISKRIAATKDVTRRRTLEDQLLSVESTIKGDQQQVGQDFLSALQFGITKAQATATFKDDAPAFEALVKGIRAQIKATGDTLDLEQQLFDAVQGLKAAKTARLSAKDFKLLGFGPTGEDIVPGKARLKKELADVQNLIGGTKFDTSKVKSQLAVIKELLTDAFVPKDIRAKMQELLSDLETKLKTHAGHLTKFRHVSHAALLAGIGLTQEEQRKLGSRLAQLGPNGSLPSRGSAFAFAGTTPAVPSRPTSHGITIHGDLVVNGVQNVKQLKNELAKEQKRRSISRRTG